MPTLLDESVKLEGEVELLLRPHGFSAPPAKTKLKSRINVLAKQWQPAEADYAAVWSLIVTPCSRAAVQTGVLPALFSLESLLEPQSHGPLPAP